MGRGLLRYVPLTDQVRHRHSQLGLLQHRHDLLDRNRLCLIWPIPSAAYGEMRRQTNPPAGPLLPCQTPTSAHTRAQLQFRSPYATLEVSVSRAEVPASPSRFRGDLLKFVTRSFGKERVHHGGSTSSRAGIVPALDEIEHGYAGLDLGLETATIEQLAFRSGSGARTATRIGSWVRLRAFRSRQHRHDCWCWFVPARRTTQTSSSRRQRTERQKAPTF